MRIGLISTPWVPVPPPAYGGTEEVVDSLARGLVAAGHDVILFTTGDSTCPVPKEWVFEVPATPMGTVVAEARHVIAAYDAVAGLDVVHDHTVFGPLYAERYPRLPVVTTNHGPFTDDARAIYARIAMRAAVVAISHHQRSQAPEVPIAKVIHHGIHLDDFPLGNGDGGYILFLGRMAAEKGAHRAIAVAQRAGVPLVIAAKMREQDECDYFHERIEPMLGRNTQYVGEANAEQRKELLRSARALIDPIRWPEPFGLVMIEAMACGTPVIVFPEGAAPEIVEDGKTGFICDDENGMIDAVGHIDAIERRACRSAVEERFTAERMALDHLDLYEEVIARGTSA